MTEPASAAPATARPLSPAPARATAAPGRRGQIRFVRFAALAALALAGSAAWGATLVQEFYLPLPESQIRNTFTTLQTSGIGSTFDTTFSIVITAAGTLIYYDQWEDGYEVNLASPSQATTKIWGDGNDANGIPPGYTHDPTNFTAGTVLTLRNNVTLPRNPSTILFDGRDRVAATKAIVISRAAWATTPGTVLATAVEVPATIDYGYKYVCPVGQDVSANGMFQYAGLFVMAGQDGTAVTIDTNGLGGTVSVVLNRGESYQVNGGIRKGATVTASNPVEVHLGTGKIAANYESRWFRLYPVEQWYSSYITPVGTSSNANPAYVFLFNTNAAPLNITCQTQFGSSALVVPGTNGVLQYQMPANSGARFSCATSLTFYALETVGANPTANQVYDWGFTLVPADGLTPEAVVGWGPGSSDLTANGSPVWVTPMAAARVYVDYAGDGKGALTDPKGNKYDIAYDLAALQSQRVYDPIHTNNQTAMLLYTLDSTPIAAAWGEDPAMAGPANPFIDAGTTVIPFPVPVLTKTSRLYVDYPPTNRINTNDVLMYTITVDNKGLLPLGNTVVVDPLPATLLYITNSTSLDGTPIPDDLVGTTKFSLDEAGYTIPIILRGGSSHFDFQARIVGTGTIVNAGFAADQTSSNQVIIPVGGPASTCTVSFVDSTWSDTTVYTAGSGIYVQLVATNANTDPSTTQTITAVVQDLTSGDVQTITLIETGTNTSVFRISSPLPLPTSTTSGMASQDGTLFVANGDSLLVSYTDPLGIPCSDAAVVVAPQASKILYLTEPTQSLDRIDPVAVGDSTATNTAVLGGGSSGKVIVDNVSTGRANAASLTISHVTGPGTNRLMVVGVAIGAFTSGARVTNITYGAQSLTLVTTNLYTEAGNYNPRTEIWKLANPTVGTNNVVIQISASRIMTVGVSTFDDVDQTSPIASTNSQNGTTANPSVTVTNGSLYYAVVCADKATPSAVLTSAVGQTNQWNAITNNGTSYMSGAGDIESGTNSATLAWTMTAANAWSACAAAIRAASGSVGGTNSATFTQAPPFALPFSMISGSTIQVTNFVTVVSGAMPVNPAIYAILSCGGTNFITLTNATYNSATSNIVWTGTLTNAFAAGTNQAISLIVTSLQSGVTFQIDYDSVAKPSKILLPTTNVIAISSLAVYDAPYPGGTNVSGAANGATLYVRVTATDPFGAYDITGGTLAIASPDGTTNTVALTDASVVSSNSYSKTYQYQWLTTSVQGNYTIVATLNEGTEGIKAQAATSIPLSFLDLGTPSTTWFTDPSGAHTNAYGTNQTVFVKVTDLDQNLNTGAVDSVVVVITSTSGDSETNTLYETGPNTGIFTGSVAAVSTGTATNNNGVLTAPPGAILTVTYVDPTDPTDTSQDAATVPVIPGTPAITVQKTLVSPSGGQTIVGQTVQYAIRVVNVGSITLTNVSLSDRYPSNALAYQSAAPPATSSGNGTSTWSSIGPLVPGQQTNLTVYFTATGSAAPATNTAIADSGLGVTATNRVNVTITRPAVFVSKTVLAPIPGPASIGSNVQFRIVITNTGDTAIPTLPLEDTFSGVSYAFVSATITPDGTGAGDLFWNDLTGAGSLAPGAAITNDITLRATGTGNPAPNSALVDYAVDINGDSVPPSDSTTGMVIQAASISGTVYDDKDTNGVLSAGDVGLDSVTLNLYTDPNGDGNPADGTLVAIVTSGSSGTYQFLNLSTGRYVVVETDPAGYASSGDSVGANDNRIPLSVTNLTAYTNNNFFDYLPPPVSYGTIGGTVYLDINGNAVRDDGGVGIFNATVDLVQDVNSNGLADAGEPIISSMATSTNGAFLFQNVVPGKYVLRETDLYGYYSTVDSSPTNDNQVPVTLPSGGTSTNNYFLDTQFATLTVNVFNDLNGNGTQDAGDTNWIAGAKLILLDANSNAVATATTTAAGAVTFTNLQAGTYRIVETNAAGWVSTSPTNDQVTVTLTSGQPGSATFLDTAYADLGVIKTVDNNQPGTNDQPVVYTIMLTNNGPLTASSVVLTDRLPTGLTYTGYSTSQGAYNSTNGLWTVGTVVSNGGAVLTLNATVNGGTKYWHITNAVTITGMDGVDPVSSNNSSSVEIVPTRATIGSFNVLVQNGQTVVEWTTLSEEGTVGFYLERRDDAAGAYHRVTASLLPGLLVAPQGGTYHWIDADAIAGGSYTYRLVEVDQTGRLAAYGPYPIQIRAAAATRIISSAAPYTKSAHAPTVSRRTTPAIRTAGVTGASTPSSPVLKIGVTKPGLYSLDAATLAGCLGVSADAVNEQIAARAFRMQSRGSEIAWLPSTNGLCFYGDGIDSIYTERNAYRLDSGVTGTIMRASAGAAPSAVGAASFPDTRHMEQDRYALTAIFDQPRKSFWVWDYFVAGDPTDGRKTFAFDLADPDVVGSAEITVNLKGGSETGVSPEHRVRVRLNGTLLGEAVSTGLTAFAASFTFDQSLLHATGNRLDIKAVLDAGVPYSIFYLQSFDVRYRHNYVAANDSLRGRGNGSNTVITVTGFHRPDVQVLDVTSPAQPVVLAAAVEPDSGGYRATFAIPAPGSEFCAAALSSAPAPETLGAWTCAGLRSTTNAADWLIIAPSSLSVSAQRLAQYRVSKGWQANWVDIESVYNEFNYGIVDPAAIRAFLAYAYRNWSVRPACVALGGRGSYDYKNALGFGDCLIPPLLMSAADGLIASDGQLADMNGDGIPEMAIGRLPALTDDELNGMVDKIEAYESGGDWKNSVVMVADIPDTGGNFDADSATVATLINPTCRVDRISLSETSFPDARSQLLTDLNNGCGIMNYLGHAGLTQLSANGILADNDVAGLLNADRSPIMAAMSCDLGRFDLPGFASIGEQLATASNGGAVAVWAPVSATYNFISRQLDLNLFGALFRQGDARVGDAVLTATRGLPSAAPATVGMYNLLGDPATAIGDVGSAPVRAARVPLTYAEWALAALPPVLAADNGSLPMADPAGSGVPNLLAYAMGLDSCSSTGLSLDALLACTDALTVDGIQQFVVLVKQRADVSDLVYVLQTRHDLLADDWQDSESFREIGRQSRNSVFDEVQYAPASPFDGLDSLYVRLKILLITHQGYR